MPRKESSSNSLEQVLLTLGSPEDAVARETCEFQMVAQNMRKVVIFGCGHLGSLALAGAVGAGLDVLAFADNNQANWGRTLKGVPVIPPEKAVLRYNDDAFFVVAIYNGSTPRKQLRVLGCNRIVPYPMFFWRFSQFMPEEDRLELPHRIFERMEDIRHSYQLLADATSRSEFAAQIQWRCTLDYGCLPSPAPASEMYYAPDLVRLTGDEVFIDCGAFDGDSIRTFLDRTRGSFRRIYALEPDTQNRTALKAYLSSLPKPMEKRISVLPIGARDSNGTVLFNARGTVGSGIVASGGNGTIECRRLDDLLEGRDATFIKMDIEGAEPAAIRGAAETIRRARPILAVCAYHKCEHLWTLPKIIKGLLPDYQLFLRRYAEACWETVYYAIP